MTEIAVPVLVLPHGAGLGLPAYASAGAAGCDLMAAVPEARPVILPAGGRGLIPSGLQIALPHGFEAQVRPRSGLALRHGITVLNAPGTIDSDYRGEIQVLLVNLGLEDVTVTRGMRIAQLVVAPVVKAQWNEMSDLGETTRGSGGFGSTGFHG